MGMFRSFVAATLMVLALAVQAGERSTLIEGTVVEFADLSDARAVLGADDDWLRATSALQRQVLVGARSDPLPFLAFQAGRAIPWTGPARARWLAALKSIAVGLNTLQLPWPERVLLVATDGRESAYQPHTRGNAVMLPGRFEQQQFSDAEVLAHELWHVVSRHRPELAQRLYALIGYQPVAELEWPAAWDTIRLANPDAPRNRHAMPLTLDGRATWVMPVTVIAPGGPRDSLLDRMEQRLLEVVPGEGGQPTRARLRDGKPVWHDPEETPAFMQRLGGNTDYVLHPEETIADNVMFLICGRTVPNITLLEKIRDEILRR
ncbi:eCIS core domain-containing protein [Piscinibacter defluvii]|uniref:eCIS core domain-containing protein n=1 Tax=Piscinibacter defluvii TaxID=1796922 RepID=UPI000FDDD78E|nr:DUF4157 domain-containing protein [Piscinibacter defluvii]